MIEISQYLFIRLFNILSRKYYINKIYSIDENRLSKNINIPSKIKY
jgi:hypothetical protein